MEKYNINLDIIGLQQIFYKLLWQYQAEGVNFFFPFCSLRYFLYLEQYQVNSRHPTNIILWISTFYF